MEHAEGRGHGRLVCGRGQQRRRVGLAQVAKRSVSARFWRRGRRIHPQTKAMVGAELSMVVDGVSFKEYVEFVSPSCILRITRESGFSLEGC